MFCPPFINNNHVCYPGVRDILTTPLPGFGLPQLPVMFGLPPPPMFSPFLPPHPPFNSPPTPLPVTLATPVPLSSIPITRISSPIPTHTDNLSISQSPTPTTPTKSPSNPSNNQNKSPVKNKQSSTVQINTTLPSTEQEKNDNKIEEINKSSTSVDTIGADTKVPIAVTTTTTSLPKVRILKRPDTIPTNSSSSDTSAVAPSSATDSSATASLKGALKLLTTSSSSPSKMVLTHSSTSTTTPSSNTVLATTTFKSEGDGDCDGDGDGLSSIEGPIPSPVVPSVLPPTPLPVIGIESGETIPMACREVGVDVRGRQEEDEGEGEGGGKGGEMVSNDNLKAEEIVDEVSALATPSVLKSDSSTIESIQDPTSTIPPPKGMSISSLFANAKKVVMGSIQQPKK